MKSVYSIIRRNSTIVRDKVKDWVRVPHYNVLCIGSSGHGKTKLAHELTGISFEDLSRQSGSFNQEECEDGRKPSASTCFVEYEYNNLHFAHLDTPGDFYSNNLSAAYSAFDIIIWVINKNIGLETTDHLKLAKNLCPDSEKRTCVYLVDKNVEDLELSDLLQEEIDSALTDWGIPSSSVCFESNNNLRTMITNIVQSMPGYGEYRDDPLMHLPIERSFAVTGVGQIAVGILKGNKDSVWKPKLKLDLVGENNIMPLEMIQTGMFYKSMKQSEIGDRANCLLRSTAKKFGKFVHRGAVLVPEGRGAEYHKDEFSFTPDLDTTIKYTRAAAHTWNVSIADMDQNSVKLDKKLFIRPGDKVTFFSKLHQTNRFFQTVTVL